MALKHAPVKYYGSSRLSLCGEQNGEVEAGGCQQLESAIELQRFPEHTGALNIALPRVC